MGINILVRNGTTGSKRRDAHLFASLLRINVFLRPTLSCPRIQKFCQQATLNPSISLSAKWHYPPRNEVSLIGHHNLALRELVKRP